MKILKAYGITEDNKIEEIKYNFNNTLEYTKGLNNELDKLYIKKDKYLYSDLENRPFINFNQESQIICNRLVKYLKDSNKKFNDYNEMNKYIEDNNHKFKFTIGEILTICSIFDEWYCKPEKITIINYRK